MLCLIAVVGSFVTERVVESGLPAWAQKPKPKPLPAWFWPLAAMYAAVSLWLWTR